MADYDGQDLSAFDSSEDDEFAVVIDSNQNEGQERERDVIDGGNEDESDDDIEAGEVLLVDDEADTGGEDGGGGIEHPVGLVMPRRKTKVPSPVWKCADRVEGGARCIICLRIIKCVSGSTSAIFNHLMKLHGNREEVKKLRVEMKMKKDMLSMKKVQEQKKKQSNTQPSILNFSKRRGVMDIFKKQRLDEQIVKMIIVMNKPFSDVENTFFRQVLFTAEPNYICPGRTRVTATFDKMAKKVKEDLKKEITKDVTDAGHKTLNICSDHGTSSDRFRTKKNAVTVARTTKDFVIKKDTLKLIICEGSQTGLQIRKDVKQVLLLGAGWKPGWKVNWVTDNESKQVNARATNKHQAVELPTFHTG